MLCDTLQVDARNTIRSMLDRLSCPGVRDLAVRVNSVSSGLADEDLMEIFKAERLPSTVMLPKVESKAEVQWVCLLLHVWKTLCTPWL